MSVGRVCLKGTWKIAEEAGQTAVEFLAAQTPLSRSRIKDAMNKGAVWLKRQGKEKRLRRAQEVLQSGDVLDIAYDSHILEQVVAEPRLVMDWRDYSVWDKPPGMLSQGTRQGDHLSLLRWLEKSGMPSRPHWLVHRLDREASGLIMIAHTRKASAALSALFQSRQLQKQYEVEVHLTEALRRDLDAGGWVNLEHPLDGKPARSRIRMLAAMNDAQPCDWLEVQIDTGRKHQIRRHLAGQGCPVLGDPAYGDARSADPRGLRLRAVGLEFRCPLRGQVRRVRVPGLRGDPL